MFNTVKKSALIVSLAVATFAAMPAVAEKPAISKIDIKTNFDAAQNSNALVLYPEIETDLAQSIASRVETSEDADDPTIRIEITKISLDGDTMLPDSAEFNELEGLVIFEDNNNEIPSQTFPVMVAAYSADTIVPEGYVLMAPDREDFYQGLLSTFADTVADLLPDETNSKVSR